MTISFARRLAAGALAAALACHSAFAADLAAAKKIVTDVCQACHAIDGNSQIAENPKLAGQNPDYLAKALRDYKSGARKNPIMGGMAAALTTADIDNLSAYYASQPAVLSRKY
jgi:cytochrome c553